MADEILHLCVDRWLPGESPAERPAQSDHGKLALEADKWWEPGRTLRVRFLDGDAGLQARVMAAAKEWCTCANIKFDFGDHPMAEIRISFFADDGSWSYIGKDALGIPGNKPTMNFGWLRPETDDQELRRVVLHEFGHALGCIHEHQNPATKINWNKPAVYAYYAKQGWTKRDVDFNLFKLYAADTTQFTAFDRKSIMLYPVLKAHTLDGFEVGWNLTLSDVDKDFIGQWYPFPKE